MVLTYAYYGYVNIYGVLSPDPEKYMVDLRKIVESGNFQHVQYCGQMNCTCGGTENFGAHYAFIFEADKKKTKELLEMIETDYCESFDMETMEKLNKDLEKVEPDFWTI